MSNSSWCASCASTTPWSASETVVRYRRSSSSRVERAGDVDAGEINTAPPGMVCDCATASVTPDDNEPTMPPTPSMLISALAASVAICSLVPESRCTTSSSAPLTPPASLTIWTARSTALWIGGPNVARSPVASNRVPILTFSATGSVAGVAVAAGLGVAVGAGVEVGAAGAVVAVGAGGTGVAVGSSLWHAITKASADIASNGRRAKARPADGMF